MIQDCDAQCAEEEYEPACTKGSSVREVNLCLARCQGTEITEGECPSLIGHLEIDYQIDGGSIVRKSESSVTSTAFFQETAIVQPVAAGVEFERQEIVKLRDQPNAIRVIIVTPTVYESRPTLKIT